MNGASKGLPFLQAAVEGVTDIAGPVLFAVLTNIVAFLPLAFLYQGTFGKFFGQIPAIVVAVFVVSLIESLFILPAHLSRQTQENRVWAVRSGGRAVFLTHLLQRGLTAGLPAALACGSGQPVHNAHYGNCAADSGGRLAIGGGHIPFSFIPRIDTDVVTAQATLPFGVPMETARRVQHQLLATAEATVEGHGRSGHPPGHVCPESARPPPSFGPPRAAGPGGGGSHLVGVQVSLVPSDQREIDGMEFADAWRAVSWAYCRYRNPDL